MTEQKVAKLDGIQRIKPGAYGSGKKVKNYQHRKEIIVIFFAGEITDGKSKL